MSRTYRKSDVQDSESIESYIEKDVAYYKAKVFVNVWSITKENQAAYDKAYKEYKESFWGIPPNWYAYATCKKEFYDLEKIKIDAEKQYKMYSRDGKYSETTANKGFKKASAKAVRNANTRLCKNILKDNDWDHLPFPGTYLGKKFVWDFW